MKKILFISIALGALLLTYISMANKETPKDEQQYIAIAKDYVINKLDWLESDIAEVSFEKDSKSSSDNIEVTVTHKDDIEITESENSDDILTTGGGKSVLLLINSDKLEVIKVLYFQ